MLPRACPTQRPRCKGAWQPCFPKYSVVVHASGTLLNSSITLHGYFELDNRPQKWSEVPIQWWKWLMFQSFSLDIGPEVLQNEGPIGAVEQRVHGEVLWIPRHQLIDGFIVEGGQGIYKPEKWLVRDLKSKGAIYLLNGSNFLIVQGKMLHQVIRGMDSPSLHCGYFQE